jgi:hypothetical protein
VGCEIENQKEWHWPPNIKDQFTSQSPKPPRPPNGRLFCPADLPATELFTIDLFILNVYIHFGAKASLVKEKPVPKMRVFANVM